MTIDNRSFMHQNFHMSLNLGQRREGRGREGRGREGSKTICAQNRALQLSAINLIGLTIIYFAKSLKCSLNRESNYIFEISRSRASNLYIIRSYFRSLKLFSEREAILKLFRSHFVKSRHFQISEKNLNLR